MQPAVQLFEVLPDGAERLYSEARAFADEGAAAAPDGGGDFRKWVYRAPKAGDYAPVAPAEVLLRVVDGEGRVLLEEGVAFPSVKNPSARGGVAGFLCPVDAAAARGTPFEAANAEYAALPGKRVVTLGDRGGTPCAATLTFRRAPRPEWVHCGAAAGDIYAYRLRRATVWLR